LYTENAIFDKNGMVLHVFNPSHDEALAAASPYYTPRPAARRMEAELARLPDLWRAEEDAVFDLSERTPFAAWDRVERIEPWGWDARLSHLLRKRGAPERLLPTDAALAHIRRLSSRETAVRLLSLVRADVAGTVGESRFCRDLSGIRPGDVLKAPWSCSGRGVFRAATDPGLRRAARILRKQGGIAAESYVAHEQDFAMEFFYQDGVLRYEGLSLFRTSASGAYVGNVVAAENELRRRLLGDDAALAHIYNKVCRAVCRHLPPLLGEDYEGPLGIDMMLCGGRIHPCVEINLRQTMGRVALRLRQKVDGTAVFFLGEERGRLVPRLVPMNGNCQKKSGL